MENDVTERIYRRHVENDVTDMIYTPEQIEILKRRNQPVSVRSLCLQSKTGLMRRRWAYAKVLGITKSELDAQARMVSVLDTRIYRRHLRMMIARKMDQTG